LSLGYRLEGTKLLAEEKRLARQFDLCTTTTRGEWETLEGLRTARATDWFPNGVDDRYFVPGASPHDPNTIAFVGRMDYFPNQEAMLRFCRDILPLLQQRRPQLRLLIVGAEPSAAVRRLGELPGVTVTGSVPDVRPFLERAALTLAPLSIARGTQNKILEAMAQGIPVVASTTAARGVDAVPGRDLLVADSTDECVTAILRVLDSPEERARLSRCGRERVLSHHNWAESMRRLDAIIERCTGGPVAGYPGKRDGRPTVTMAAEQP